ncbi:hypothetical protein AMTR_s00021p00130460 [Amborella trichopoda]|uniref:Uncharacterized protein n=1 Tax=Amborella trichopoda TaxID=13333 RepID=W1Q0Z7_AMBTC|nr:hypothetical protein AMTR_s00021p00130460 [Amborella trichopoda]
MIGNHVGEREELGHVRWSTMIGNHERGKKEEFTWEKREELGHVRWSTMIDNHESGKREELGHVRWITMISNHVGEKGGVGVRPCKVEYHD